MRTNKHEQNQNKAFIKRVKGHFDYLKVPIYAQSITKSYDIYLFKHKRIDLMRASCLANHRVHVWRVQCSRG